jgi:TM2 domain-containing membrane protein YozV
MFCTRCGANNLETDQFCRSCSAPLAKPGASHGQGASSAPPRQAYPDPTFEAGRRQPNQENLPYPGYQGYSSHPGYQYSAMAAQDWRALGADKKLAAGILGILVGGLGIHKFVLGYTSEGLIMLLVTVLTCGIGWIVFGPIGLIEGILYLVKSDEEFVGTYIQNKRGWF